MYNNFGLNDKERKSILEQHEKYGYKKSLMEDNDQDSEFEYYDMNDDDIHEKKVEEMIKILRRNKGTGIFPDMSLLDIINRALDMVSDGSKTYSKEVIADALYMIFKKYK